MDSLDQDRSPTATITSSAFPGISQPMTQFQAAVVILLMCIGLGLLGWYTFEVSARFEERFDSGLAKLSTVNDKMYAAVEWEYRIESLPDRTFDQRINALGQEGWELVFARRASDGSDYSPTFS